jgi:hypothetical protein
MTLTDAVCERRLHRRRPDGTACAVCGERHPCHAWRLARAGVLVMVRRGFAAARNGESL